jgi:gamma-glutamyltranspeptidase/glutathione hydrolase
MKKIFIIVLSVFVLMTQIALYGTVTEKNKNPLTIKDSREKRPSRIIRSYNNTFISTGTIRSRQVGIDTFNRGGNAMDAALASALTRIVDDMGCIVSFAGIFMMVYYEASTGKVYSLNACFKTPFEETNPLTIPRGGIPNARAVLVPGFMAGVQAAHDRFGRLPLSEIFAPAIDLAENGFPLASWQVEHIRNSWHILGVLPESRNIFLKRRYGLFRSYQPGDIFTQPELAHTLRQVASFGASYMYTGAWGRKLVEIIHREGGHLTNRDMEEYEPVWADPVHTTYNGYDIYALGYPSLGAMSVVLSINLFECANLSGYDHCSRSADALYRLIYCSRAAEFFYPAYAPEIINTYILEGNFNYEARANKENACLIWDKIESGEWSQIEQQIAYWGNSRPGHSEAIITMDREGNLVAICHTINTDNWGNSGIFVDGVSVPGAASEQQVWVDKVGPGAYLPDTTNPILVLRDGLPAIASSCIGSDLHSATVQNLYNMLNFGMSMGESRATPKFQSINWQNLSQRVRRYVFSQSLIEAVQAMGISFTFVDHGPSEYWIGLRLPH